MNQEVILNYVKLYKIILERQQIFLNDRDFDNIYRLILLVFKLDDLYDRINKDTPSKDNLNDIKTAMISLMPDRNPSGLQAIASVFKAMQDESLLKARSLTLRQYLEVTSKSIGASIIATYLASKLQLQQNIWYANGMPIF